MKRTKNLSAFLILIICLTFVFGCYNLIAAIGVEIIDVNSNFSSRTMTYAQSTDNYVVKYYDDVIREKLDNDEQIFFDGGTGTVSDPYLVSTAEQLAYISYVINNDVYHYNYVIDFPFSTETNENLPEGYKLLDYLESTGEEFIVTDIVPDQNTRVVCDFQLTEVTQSFLFGSRTSRDENAYTFSIEYSPLRFFSNYGTENKTIQNPADLNRHIVDKDKSKIYFDGNLVHEFSETEFTCPARMNIFASYNNKTSGLLPCKAKIYSMQVYDGETKVADYIPCFKEDIKALGLYDVVSGSFYESANVVFGNGEKLKAKAFTLTKDISMNEGIFDAEEVLEPDGKQRVTDVLLDYKTTSSEEVTIYKWTPMKYFGTFDGGNFKINGLYIEEEDNVAFIDSLVNVPTVKNLHITNSFIKSLEKGAAGITTNLCYINNCSVAGTIVGLGKVSAGLFLVQSGNGSTTTECINYANVYGKGAFGMSPSGNGIRAENCINYGNIYNFGGSAPAAGIGPYNGVIKNCKNYGNVSSPYGIGNYAYTAGISSNRSTVTVENCDNYGDIHNNGNGSAGIVAYCANGCKISNCNNYGTITGGARVAGIIGSTNDLTKGNNYVKNCNNYGKVVGSGIISGSGLGVALMQNCNNYGEVNYGLGVVGVTTIDCNNYGKVKNGGFVDVLAEGFTLKNCNNYGVVTGSTNTAGGIARVNNGNILNCKNYANVSATGNAGGICVTNNGIIKQCVNLGNVKSKEGMAGGIAVIHNALATIKTCVNEGDVIGTTLAGGLVAQDKEIIKDCINHGDVTCDKSIGLVGGEQAYDNLINCINSGKLNNEILKYFVGKDFSKFYFLWKTSKIGLSAIDGNGFFQGIVDEAYLISAKYQGINIDKDEEYIRLNYIQSTGNEYIDTGIKANDEIGLYLDFQSISYGSDDILMGALKPNLCIGIGTYGSISCSDQDGTGSSYSFKPDDMKARHVIEINYLQSGKYKMDNQSVDMDSKMTTTGNSIYIFAGNMNYAYGKTVCKVFSAKISDGTKILRDFIPVKRKSDGVAGLYDLIEGKFYGNSGTGAFVAGTPV